MIDDKITYKILNGVNIGIWVLEFVENSKPKMFANKTMLRLLQAPDTASPEEIFQTWYGNIPEESIEIVNNAIETVKNEGSLEIEYLWNNPISGKSFVRCNGRLDTSFKGGLRLLGYHQDITELYLAQKEKERFHQTNVDIMNIIGTLYDGIYKVDLNKKEIFILKPFLDGNLTGKSLEYGDFLNQFSKFFDVKDNDDLDKIFTLENLFNIFSHDCKRYSGELKRVDKLNSYMWYEYTISQQKSFFEGDFLIMTFKDITSRKRMEERDKRILKEAYISANQANNAKSSFLSRMSHDIRTPMNAIIGMTRMALSSLNDKNKVEICLNKIHTAGELLLNIINQVLDMTKIEINKYEVKEEVFRLDEFIDDLLAIYQESIQEKNQTLVLDIESIKDKYVCTDIIILQRILTNLISNAIKYTHKNGKIEIKVLESGYEKKNSRVYQFIIKDNGIGMSKEFLEKIYEPFTREVNNENRSISGSGLGMSIVRNLVSLLNGKIHIESEVKKGTTFSLTLELKVIEKENFDKISDGKDLSLDKLNLKGKKILIAEDNEINREIICDLLAITGAELVEVENGKLAVEKFETSKLNEFDLILMDIQMPIMNGYEATKKIRNLNREDAQKICISAMTANSFLDDIALAKEVGMNNHISKPVDIPKLVKVLKTIL